MAKKRNAQPEEEPAMDISSLIDVCFLLLIYFIVATTLTPEENDIQQTIPAPSTNTSQETPKHPKLEIELSSDGLVSIRSGSKSEALDGNALSRELPMLKRRVRMYASGSTDPKRMDLQVQIYIDGNAKQQRFMDVMNVIKQHNIPTIGLTVASGGN